MRYIRFLKVPKCERHSITAVVTITSDLGETFLAEDTFLNATLLSADQDGRKHLRQTLRWKAGMRALPLSFKIQRCDLQWPVRICVSAKDSTQSDGFDSLHGAVLPTVISAWSDVLDLPHGITEARRTVERRFSLTDSRKLSIWEDTGESIARHLWYYLMIIYEKTRSHCNGVLGTAALRSPPIST